MIRRNRFARLRPDTTLCWVAPALVIGALLTARSWGTVPVNPLPTPLYSFDSVSCQVVGTPDCPPLFKAADILEEGPMVGPAVVFVPAANIGLGMNGDALNSMSFANAGWNPGDPFTILFSLDRDSTGLAPPDPKLLANCIPFNATDQCTRGTQAGDEYMSTLGYVLNGSFRLPNNQLALTANSVLVLNNYNEGGTDHKAMPAGAASGTAPFPLLQEGITDDNVSSSAYQNGPAPASMPVQRVYYTANPNSPSLPLLSNPNPPSGAHIFFVQNPVPPPATVVTKFATAALLNLQVNDVIDGLVVFDFNNDGVFNGTDQVLFSLAPDSPSLALIPGASATGAAADVFRVRFGQPPQLFAAAGELGLGAPTDNIDSLEILPCGDPFQCALNHGILGDDVVPGCPAVSTWGVAVFALLVLTGATIVLRRRAAVLAG